jgi:integrase
LNRQLALRRRLELAGKIYRDHLFFKETGDPIRSLQYPYRRWRWTLARNSTIRYRKPYCARHSSASWDLMVGRKPLWVAKQHGHSITTMLRAYAAWAEDAIEADIKAIKHAMDFSNNATKHNKAVLSDAKLTQTSMFAATRDSELIGPEFSLHSFYKRVETTEPHFQ